MTSGFIYILTNPMYTDVVKIGKTTRTVEERVRELSSHSGVPAKFEIAFKSHVSDCDLAESLIHKAFKEFRYGREFFKVEPKHAIAVAEKIIDVVDMRIPPHRVNPFPVPEDVRTAKTKSDAKVINEPVIGNQGNKQGVKPRVNHRVHSFGKSKGYDTGLYSVSKRCPNCSYTFSVTVLKHEVVTFCPNCSMRISVK